MDEALSTLIKEDAPLFSFDMGNPERSIAHKLGCYLQPLFENRKVDCEYNRHLDEIKRSRKRTPIIPDIVIHDRKDDGNNLLVIEIKVNGDIEGIQEDIDKLIDLTDRVEEEGLRYDYGLFILFNGIQWNLFWFEGGEMIPD